MTSGRGRVAAIDAHRHSSEVRRPDRANLAAFPEATGKAAAMNQAFDPHGVEQTVFVVDERHETLDEPWQAQRRTRLIYVSEGVLTVHMPSRRWVVPPGHALWITADVRHRLCAPRPVRLHSLHADVRAAPLPAQSGAVVPDALAQALLIAAAALPHDKPLDEPGGRLVQVLLDRLQGLPAAPLGLTWPQDPRIQRIADTLNANPAQATVLDDLASAAGVTGRTAARLFVRETGQTFGQWRQQLRLLVALEHLGAGASVTQVALEIGYNDVSSFIAVFREAFGDTPARYFR
jgi:AraC-like DNA-binding protein/quercetin dioxygenase-like cupin family protein